MPPDVLNNTYPFGWRDDCDDEETVVPNTNLFLAVANWRTPNSRTIDTGGCFAISATRLRIS